MRSLIIPLFALCGMTLSAAGQHSANNAATWYQQAIDQFQSSAEYWSGMMEHIVEYQPGTAPTPELRAALTRAQSMMDHMRLGAAQEYSDFQLDYSQGVAMLLPHLGYMRQVARIMNVDALVKFHDGDGAAGAQRLADLYRMSGHFRDDRVPISSLVGNAIFALTERSVQGALDRGVLSAEESKSLVQALTVLNASDPFGFVEAVAGEQEMMVNWLREQAASPEFFSNLEAMSGGGLGAGIEAEEALLLMSQDRFEDEIEVYDQMMTKMVEIFMMPDRDEARQAMATMEDEIEANMLAAQAGGEGLLAAITMPAMGRLLEQRDKSEQALAERLTALRALAGGQATVDDFANAALWYMRGMALLAEMNPEVLAEVRAFAADTSAPLSVDLAEWLAKPLAQDAIAILREGSMKRRCDFQAVVPPSHFPSVVLAPSYAIGMHEALRLIHSDAVRLLRADHKELGADLLSVALRMSAHMGGDPCILSALVSHRNLMQTMGLIETGLANGMVEAAVKPTLQDALERHGRSDPFGYIKAVVTTREQLAKKLAHQTWPLNLEADRIDRLRFEQAVKSFHGDQVLYLLTLVDAMHQNATTHRDTSRDPRRATLTPLPVDTTAIAKVKDVLALAQLEQAHDQLGRVAPLLASGKLNFVEDGPVPAIAWSSLANNLSDHVRRARADLRQAFTTLRAEHEPISDSEGP